MEDSPIRVLLVEDDEEDFLITRALLCEVDGIEFELEWVATYEAGLQRIARVQHDVGLVDYRLAERDGLNT